MFARHYLHYKNIFSFCCIVTIVIIRVKLELKFLSSEELALCCRLIIIDCL